MITHHIVLYLPKGVFLILLEGKQVVALLIYNLLSNPWAVDCRINTDQRPF